MALHTSDTMVAPMILALSTSLSLSATDLLVGAAIPAAALLVVLGLHLVIPARRVEGYARCEHTDAPLRYRLNGRIVGPVTLGLWALACAQGWLPGTCCIGCAGPARRGVPSAWASRLDGPHPPIPRRGAARRAVFRPGRESPVARGSRRQDVLYLYGAVMLALNLASFAAHPSRPTAPRPPRACSSTWTVRWF